MKKIILAVGCTIFICHLLMTFLYLIPSNPVSDFYRPQISVYIEKIKNVIARLAIKSREEKHAPV